MSYTPLIAAGVSAVGSLVGGFAQSSQANRAATVENQNAKIAENQASTEAGAIREKAYRLRGSQRAQAGASGIALPGSSFVDAMSDSDINAELDAQTALYNGKIQARNYRSQALANQSTASSSIVSGIFGAGSQALSGYGNWQYLNARAKGGY